MSATTQALEPEERWCAREPVQVKGKGSMQTYYLKLADIPCGCIVPDY